MAGQDRMLKTGIIGTIVAIVCCFTPALVLLLGAAGLSAWIGWADYILLPMLGICMAMIVVAVRRKRFRAPKEASGTKDPA